MLITDDCIIAGHRLDVATGVSNMCSIFVVGFRSVTAMPGLPVLEPEPPADPVEARLDQVLAELAAAVADCTPATATAAGHPIHPEPVSKALVARR